MPPAPRTKLAGLWGVRPLETVARPTGQRTACPSVVTQGRRGACRQLHRFCTRCDQPQPTPRSERTTDAGARRNHVRDAASGPDESRPALWHVRHHRAIKAPATKPQTKMSVQGRDRVRRTKMTKIPHTTSKPSTEGRRPPPTSPVSSVGLQRHSIPQRTERCHWLPSC
jgi:hypothetical protein